MLAIIGLASNSHLYATHIIGGEISYRCLGNNQFKIFLDVYRDCYYGQAPFDQPARVSVFNDALQLVTTLNLPILTSDTIPNNISNAPCLFPPSDICVERARYEATVTLTQSGGFYFVYQRCCRNGTINNIVNPIETGATYVVYLSAAARQQCNSSPRFGFTPPVFVCVNKPLEHPHAATDIDGDSLVYKFYTPNTGATISIPQPQVASAPPYTPVRWVTPRYGLSNLLGSGTPLAINPKTGLITGLPTASGQFVVGVQVEEYRNGVLMSVVSRDLQYNVGICEQIMPTIDAPDAQCDNQTVAFKNKTNLAKTFQWYFNWPDTTWKSSLREPTITYPDTGKYVIALVAEPGNQCQAVTFDTIFLQKNSLTADFSIENYDCTFKTVLVLKDLSKDAVSPPSIWFWELTYSSTKLTSGEKNPVFELPSNVSGTVKLTVRSKNGCIRSLTKFFTTGGNNPLNSLPKELNVCSGSSISLNPNAITTGFKYTWDAPVPPAQRNSPNPSVSPTQTTNYAVTITGYDGLCESFGVVRVNVLPKPVLSFQEVLGCDARMVQFNNTSQNSPAGYFWNFGDPNSTNDTSSQTSPFFIFPSYGPYSVTLTTAASSICRDTLIKVINAKEKILLPRFDYEYTNCSENEVTISFRDQTLNSLSNTKSWFWEFSGAFNGSSTLQNPSITVNKSGTLGAKLTVYTQENCISATLPVNLNISITKLPGLTAPEVLGCLNGGVVLNKGGDPNYKYKWSPDFGLSCDGCADPTTSPSPLANPRNPTTYTVQVMNISADTCFLTKTVHVNVPREPGLSVDKDDVKTCESLVEINATTVLQPVTLGWFDGAIQVEGGPKFIANVSGSKTYTVRATDQHGCHYYNPVKISGGPVDIEVSGQQLICTNEELKVSAKNLDPNDQLFWRWTPTEGILGSTNVPNPVIQKTPGERVYKVEAINQFGCSKTDSVYVAVVDENMVLDFDAQIECSGSVVRFLNKSTNAFKYHWDFGDPSTTTDISKEINPSYTYSANGTYRVMLTIGLNVSCRDTVYKNVTITDPEFTPAFRYEFLTCDADSMEVKFYDTSVNFLNNTNSWLWKTSTGLSSTLPSPVFKIYAGQEFTISLTIGTPNGCSGTRTETLKLNFIKVNIPDTLILCLGDSLAMNPAGDTKYAYLWNGPGLTNSTLPNPKISPKLTSQYQVRITSFTPDTCTIFKTVTVFVPPKIQILTSQDTFTCGDLVELRAISNVNPTAFTWTANPGGLAGKDPVLPIAPAVDTWFRVVGTDRYGCKDEKFVFVANESVKVSIPDPNQKCPDEKITLAAKNDVPDHTLQYTWKSTPANRLFPPLNASSVAAITPEPGQTATYTLQVTNQYGCTASVSRPITTFLFKPTVFTEVKACPGVETQLNPGADITMRYNWSPSTGLRPGATSPNPVVTLTKSANYQVTISKGFGDGFCARTFDVAVVLPPVIDITETVDTFTCGSPISISATANVPVTLQWTTLQGSILGAGSSLSVNPATKNTYLVKATDSSNCSATDTVVVNNYQLDLAVDGNGIIDTCPQPSYNICITNKDASDLLSFEWTASNGGKILAGGNTSCPSVSSLQGTTALFSAKVRNQWGCTETKTVNLTTYTFDPVIRGVVTICPGVQTPINPGGNTNLQYSWSPKVGLSCYDCPNPVATLTRNQQYVATILGFNGADTCSLVQTVQVRVNDPIGLKTLPTDSVICKPTDLNLNASVSSAIAKNFVWATNADFSNPIGTTANISVRPGTTQTYYVMASDTLGCKETAQVKITSAPVDVTLASAYNFCSEKAPLRISVINNSPGQKLNFQWTPTAYIQEVQGDGSIIIVNIPSNTTFTMNVSNQFGCKASDSTRVAFYNIEPTIGAISSSKDTIIFNSGQFSQLGVKFDPTYTYNWIPQGGLSNPSIHNPKASPSATTTYTLVVTDKGNCTLERKVTVAVINPDCVESNIFIPNAFTPNGDGRNDVLYVRSHIIDKMEFAVYNRWGQKVYESTDKAAGWDGTFKGQPLSPDVYGYYLKVTCYSGDEFFKKGNITLLR